MWTRHDVVAAMLSSACYLLVAIGVAGTLLFKLWGIACLAAAVVCGVLMFRVIDPKLKAMSVAFEHNLGAKNNPPCKRNSERDTTPLVA